MSTMSITKSATEATKNAAKDTVEAAANVSKQTTEAAANMSAGSSAKMTTDLFIQSVFNARKKNREIAEERARQKRAEGEARFSELVNEAARVLGEKPTFAKTFAEAAKDTPSNILDFDF